MAVILESAHWLKWRWTLSDKDFNLVIDFTSLSLIIAVIYLTTQQSIHGLMIFLNSLPILFFVLITIFQSKFPIHFATATALLLRTASIPSRYAAGYAVVEFSQLENAYVVRKRHAHAWTLAYIDGRWQEFDTTPATWVNIEQEMATWWQPINDLWSYLSYQLTKWRWRDSENSNDWLLWLILPLTLILIWRLYEKKLPVLKKRLNRQTQLQN